MLLRALFILTLLFGLTIISLGRSRSMTLKTGRATALSPAWVNATPPRTGVRNSAGAQRLTEKQLQLLQASLRHKSGLLELGFDEQGGLTLGNRQHFAGGSATARALLGAAVDSVNLYELEGHEHSPEIAFARLLDKIEMVNDQTGLRFSIFQVQLDFADFGYLEGSREAKASFDVGFNLLHELTHGVLQLQDPREGTKQIGECEAHVNQMRRELHLPERLYYHPEITVVKIPYTAQLVPTSRLDFGLRVDANAQPRAKYGLFWQPGQVSPNAKNIAGLRQGTLGAVRR